MSKYTELAKKANQVENIEAQIENVELILKAEVEALVQTQRATVIRAKNTFSQCEKAVDKARGLITDKGSVYIRTLDAAKNARDEAAEQLRVEEDRLNDLQEDLKFFV